MSELQTDQNSPLNAGSSGQALPTKRMSAIWIFGLFAILAILPMPIVLNYLFGNWFALETAFVIAIVVLTKKVANCSALSVVSLLTPILLSVCSIGIINLVLFPPKGNMSGVLGVEFRFGIPIFFISLIWSYFCLKFEKRSKGWFAVLACTAVPVLVLIALIGVNY